MKVLDGKSLARMLNERIKDRVTKVSDCLGTIPILATVLVGDDPSSITYVKMKGNACRRVGMESKQVFLPEGTTTSELLETIDDLNASIKVHGILLQHPVPAHINERACFDRIKLAKDVDGVTCLGFGRMSMGESSYGSATPAGIMQLLDHYEIPIEGKRAVVVGRSPILGKPMAMMLLSRSATVTICHSRTKDLSDEIRRADIVVGAVGKPEFIKSGWIKTGAVVIDAGYHPGGVGDIELGNIEDKCSAYTPVPGGVGPMTIATLIDQSVQAAEICAQQMNPGYLSGVRQNPDS